MFSKRIALALLVLGSALSCTTKKNTVVTRTFHNITARYNGYYYSCENIKDGTFKIEKAHKDNFDKVLPVFIYPSADKAKATFPEFDKAIKKSSLCIQRHAIKDSKGNEIASAGNWIDNNWINIGISHFYKREFFSGIEAFEYVVRTYTKSDDKYMALLWLIKANNEIGSVSTSEQLISLLKNERNLPLKVKNEFPVVWADYYIRRGQYTEAIAKLMEASRNSSLFYGIRRKDRARYSFIVAQLLEKSNDRRRATEFYKKTIRLKPNYEMVFYSKIRLARLSDFKGNNSAKTKKDLLRMAKEFKNSDYYDVIYYTLGEMEEREKNIPQAITYYKKSVQTSTVNPNQKALSYLKLGEINFELTNYEPAEAYYDSAVVALPKDHPDYKLIEARKKTLESLVTHIKTITREDSLQRIAKMSESDRMLYIDKLIIRLKEEEERKQKEQEALKNQNTTVNNGMGGIGGGNTLPGMDQGATYYFYNPNTVALGISEFTRKWGNRVLEDNWRRSNKALTLQEDNTKPKTDSLAPKDLKGKSITMSRDMFLKDLPLNDSLLRKSDARIVKAYYMLGVIYKEELNNTSKSIAAFDQLNSRYPSNKYQLKTYYILYRIYLSEKNTPKADYYKNKILNEFPDSEFALLIKNPDYGQELSAKKGEVENYYTGTFDLFKNQDYTKAYQSAQQGLVQYGKNDYTAKFEFIKAMSAGKLQGTDSLEYYLKLLVAKYPNADITPLSNDVLESIKKQKHPELFQTNKQGGVQNTDTFSLNFDAEHFIVVVTPDDSKISDALKLNIGSFNNTYYTEKKFSISSNLFGSTKQMIVIKSFANAKEAVNYYENLNADPDVFKGGDLKKDQIILLPILADNLPFLYKKKNIEAYKLYFEDNYKKLNNKN